MDSAIVSGALFIQNDASVLDVIDNLGEGGPNPVERWVTLEIAGTRIQSFVPGLYAGKLAGFERGARCRVLIIVLPLVWSPEPGSDPGIRMLTDKGPDIAIVVGRVLGKVIYPVSEENRTSEHPSLRELGILDAGPRVLLHWEHKRSLIPDSLIEVEGQLNAYLV